MDKLLEQAAIKANDYFNLPLPARLYIDSVVKKDTTPIDENYFSTEELNSIKDLIASSVSSTSKKQTPGYVNYGTYKNNSSISDLNLISGLFTKSGRIANSLGQFNYELDENGDIVVKDTYDFNAYIKGRKTPGTEYSEADPISKIIANISYLGYPALSALGQEVLPEGSGRQIKVKIPKDMFSEDQYNSLKNYLSKTNKQTDDDSIVSYKDLRYSDPFPDTTKENF